jgi:phosphoglycerol transferase MdoB-like AlkP superfamily enzyme
MTGARAGGPQLLFVMQANAAVIWTWLVAVILLHATQLELGLGAPALGLALSSASIPALVVAVAPTRARRWVMVVMVALLAALALANAAYFRFFQHYIPLDSFSAAGNGVKHSSYLPGLLRHTDLVPAAILLLTIILTAVGLLGGPDRGRSLRRRWEMGLPIAMCAIGCLPALRWAWVVSPGDHDSGHGGFLYSELADLRRIIGERMIPANPSADEMARILRYSRHTSEAHDSTLAPRDAWFGAAAGSSVVIVKVEGMNGWLVDADLNGQPIMPFVRSFAARGLLFTDLFDATGEGRSSDADYLVMASQQRLEHGAVALVHPNLNPTTLAKILVARGYTTFSADAGSPTSWNAARRHQQFGFQQSRFGPDLGNERMGMGMPDRLFFERIAPLVEQLSAPSLSWLHTVTMHGPHREPLPAGLRSLVLGSLEGTPLGTYLDKAHYTDQVLREFVASLDSAGVLAHTTVVIYGDHTESFEFDVQQLRHLVGVGDVPSGTPTPLLEKVPLVIVPGGGTTGLRVATVGGLIDLTPTLLHLLGVAAPPSLMGHSLLPAAPGFAANASGRATTNDRLWEGHGCFSRPEMVKRPARDCDSLRAVANEQLQVSWLITRYDLSGVLDAGAVKRRSPP